MQHAHLVFRVERVGIDLPDVATLGGNVDLVVDRVDVGDVIVGQVAGDDGVDHAREEVLGGIRKRFRAELGEHGLAVGGHLLVRVRLDEPRRIGHVSVLDLDLDNQRAAIEPVVEREAVFQIPLAGTDAQQ